MFSKPVSSKSLQLAYYDIEVRSLADIQSWKWNYILPYVYNT